MSSAKMKKRPHREVTALSGELKARLRNTDYLYNCLSVGSKNRLRQYQTNLAVTRGKDDNGFDKPMKKELSRWVYSDMHMSSEISYLDHLKDDEGINFSRNYKCYAKVDEQMMRFTAKPHTSFRWNANYQLALKTLTDEFSKLRLKPLRYTCDEDILKALPKADTHSGYTYIETGIKEKGENMEGIYERYLDVVKCALRDGTINRPILLGFRTQASGEYDHEGNRTGKCKHKTRVVSMADLLFLIVELRFMKPIQDYLATAQWYTGGFDRTEISMLVSDGRAKFNHWTSIDYSSFDQTLPPWLIEDVWHAFATALDLTEEDKQLLEVVIHDTIHKDFILNEGVAHSDVGLPSGYNFTNGGGSACNRVVMLTYAFAKSLEMKMIACGDDNLVFTNQAIDLEDLASYVGKNFGMIINPDKTERGSTKRTNPQFLACEWRTDGQFRNPKLLLSRLLYPERYRKYGNGDGEITPAEVIYAYILTYRLGMEKLMNVSAFMMEYQYLKPYDVLRKVDTRYMPGAFQFMWHYTYSARKTG